MLIPGTVQAESLAEVLARCDENLRAFANLEAVYREESESLLPVSDPPSAALVHRETREHHGVWQGTMYRYDYKHRWEAQSGRVLNFDTLAAYDSSSTRLSSAQVGNVSDRRMTITHGRPPHLLAMCDFGELSLSQVTHRAPEAEPVGQLGSADYVTSELVGEEVHAGLRCFKIDCFLHFREHRMRYRFWVSPERNYLPIASAVFWSSDDSIPCSETETGDWKEIAPGIWSPFSAIVKGRQVQDDFSVDPDPSVIQKIKVSSIKLDPKYPKEFFSDVPMPVGVQIYYFEGGKLVRLDYIEDPNAKETPEQRGLIRKRFAP